jgi:phage gp16-like protein
MKGKPMPEKQYMATAAQRKAIFAAAKECGLDLVDVREILFQVSGQYATADLSRAEAQAVIERIGMIKNDQHNARPET